MDAVRNRGQFDGDTDDGDNHAEQAVIATLSILGEQLRGDDSQDLGTQLPGELGELLTQRGGDGAVLTVDEFILRLADEEGLGCATDEAAAHAPAVLSTLAESVSAAGLAGLRSHLPPRYAPLFEP